MGDAGAGHEGSYVDVLVADLGERSRSRRLADGEVLVAQGDAADDVFVVTAGRLDAIRTSGDADAEVVVGSVGTGQIVGEVTVVAGGRRTATLRADGPAQVLAIARSDFEAWLAARPEAADAVSSEARARIDRSHVVTMVAELLGGAEPATVQEIVDRIEWRRLAAGDVLFEQGDPSDAAFFVVAGRVRVTMQHADGRLEPLVELGRGAVVGELGLLDRSARSATVRAVRDTTLARFGADVFEEMVTRSPGLMLHVTRQLLPRVLRGAARPSARPSTVAIAVTAPADPGPIVEGMVRAVARFGTVRHLSSDLVDALLHRPGIAQVPSDDAGVPRLSEFMHEADVGNDMLVLEADRQLTGWTLRALHQADRVVVVCSPRPSADERRSLRAIVDAAAGLEHTTVMLAVLHPAGGDLPRGTAALMRDLGIDEVVHIRTGSDADLARLGRLATGRGVGLVLSGGGARGFAHLGAYRALVESGVPIDALAGCSMGATIAGGIAMGTPDEELVPLVERQFHRLLDYTLPVVSLMKGERISASIREGFGDLDVEDFVLPYYCVSTNITRSQLEVHRRGNAALAIRASVAIPGILPPVPWGDDLLVDGGVLDNMPFTPMRNDGRIGTVIAVDVAPTRGPRSKGDYGTSVSGVRALTSRMRRGGNVYPSVSAVLLRSMLVGAMHNQRAALTGGAVDLLLRLDLPGVGLLDFGRVAEVEARGYASAAPAVREWAAANGWGGATS